MPAAGLGAAGAWQKLLKLRTMASALQTTAHPDDEHGGVLAMLSRGQGARVSLLTLTRGESGDNAIGPELFDGLGLIRTEDLLVANHYYGVDRQYFGTVVDYGFSKRLDEALDKWGTDPVLRDVVGVIRTERPFVLIANFQGNERDGHGNHSAAGLVTQQRSNWRATRRCSRSRSPRGFAVAAVELYMGGVRETRCTLRIDAGGTVRSWAIPIDSLRAGLELPAIAECGRFSPRAGSAGLVLQAAAIDRSSGTCQGTVVLRRHRHGRSGSLSCAAQDGAGGRRRRC